MVRCIILKQNTVWLFLLNQCSIMSSFLLWWGDRCHIFALESSLVQAKCLKVCFACSCLHLFDRFNRPICLKYFFFPDISRWLAHRLKLLLVRACRWFLLSSEKREFSRRIVLLIVSLDLESALLFSLLSRLFCVYKLFCCCCPLFWLLALDTCGWYRSCLL